MPKQTHARLEDQMRKLMGLTPYNTPSNICWGDGYFAMSIKHEFGEKAFEAMQEKLTHMIKTPHVCKQDRTCRCSIVGLEPDELCPVHGVADGRCACDRFIKRSW